MAYFVKNLTKNISKFSKSNLANLVLKKAQVISDLYLGGKDTMLDLAEIREKLNNIVDLSETTINIALVNRVLFDYSYAYLSQVLNREDIAGNFSTEYIVSRTSNLIRAYNAKKKGKFSDYIDDLIDKLLLVLDSDWS